MCERWRRSFQDFIDDMGQRPSPEHTLDRYPDNNGNYEPGNCRWATRTEQNRNTRANRYVTVDDITKPLHEWLVLTKTNGNTFYRRLRRGLSEAEALGLHRPKL